MKYGSLCSGIGGLDLAIEATWDATPAWFCEADPHARTILERHWPGVPVLPDLKTQDWSSVEPVELVCAGYPCQPFSMAGRRAGVDDPRHLWPFVLDAVRVLRPRLVVAENVSGHLGLGFDRVLADLAEAGFDAEWTVVRASDVGACHRRERLFVLAHAERQPVRVRPGSVGSTAGAGQGEGDQRQRVRADNSDGGPEAATDPGGGASSRRPPEPGRRPLGRVAAGRAGQDVPADANGDGPSRSGVDRRSTRAGVRTTPDRRDSGPTPDAAHIGRQRGGEHGDGGLDLRTTVAHAYGMAGEAPEPVGGRPGPMGEPGAIEGAERLRGVDWGDYGPAIVRWERVLGRPAPRPTDEKGRLSVDFVEWMMGFEAGWVDGLTRTASLRCLGNAVVPQQGEWAVRGLARATALAPPTVGHPGDSPTVPLGAEEGGS